MTTPYARPTLSAIPYGDGLRVVLPEMFCDGDAISVSIYRRGRGFTVSDDGMTAMHNASCHQIDGADKPILSYATADQIGAAMRWIADAAKVEDGRI